MTHSIAPNLTRFYSLYMKYLNSRDFYDLPASVGLDKCLHRVKKDRELLKHISPYGRFIVYPKDVALLYDEVFYNSRQVLQEIRDQCNLPAGAPVLINDLCEHSGNDFQTVYKIMNKNHPNNQVVPTQLPPAWMKFFETRDWYDLPDSIDAGNSLQTVLNGNVKNIKRNTSPQLIVYRQHIEGYFKYEPNAAFAFLQEVRKSQNLPISTPVMIGDVNAYRKHADNKFLFFIMDN